MDKEVRNALEALEKMTETDDCIGGAISIEKKHVVIVHDYFAEVLNLAQHLVEEAEKQHIDITREECAGRILMVSMMYLEKYCSNHPDEVEELLVSAHLERQKGQAKDWNDAMFG